MRAYGVFWYILWGMSIIFADFSKICCPHAQYLKADMAEEICCLLYHLDSIVDFEQQPMQALGWEWSFTRSYILVRILKRKMSIWKRLALFDDVAVPTRIILVFSLIVLTCCLIVSFWMIIGRLITRWSSSWRIIVGMFTRWSSLSLVWLPAVVPGYQRDIGFVCLICPHTLLEEILFVFVNPILECLVLSLPLVLIQYNSA